MFLWCAATTNDKNQGAEVPEACLHLPANTPAHKANIAFERIGMGRSGPYINNFSIDSIKINRTATAFMDRLEALADSDGLVEHHGALSPARAQRAGFGCFDKCSPCRGSTTTTTATNVATNGSCKVEVRPKDLPAEARYLCTEQSAASD